VVQTGQASRQAAVAQAETIIDAGVQSFMHWMDQRGAVPLIQQLNAQADEWRRHAELATRAQGAWPRAKSVEDGAGPSGQGPERRKCCTARWPNCTAAAKSHQGNASDASSAIQHFFLRKER
jgi:glutamyl-tRNA reductase